MDQAKAKLEFVVRYCPPRQGWTVFVDVDASEEGRTGGVRKSPEAILRQQRMRASAPVVLEDMRKAGVHVGARAKNWARCLGGRVLNLWGDRDIIAVDEKRSRLLICEVEGVSSGQPEQKVYRAVGQVVYALSRPSPDGFERWCVIAVSDEKLVTPLESLGALAILGVTALWLGHSKAEDRPLFGPSLP